MNLNGAEYYYVRNGQNDIIGLFDDTGTQVVSYTYDAWGKVVSVNDTSGISLGTKNPYLYKGYRYDTETGLYYLQSRYYNPEWGRFINADGFIGQIGELTGHNLFAYCQNNPVNETDSTGRIIDTLADIGFITWDVVDIIRDPKNGWNWTALGTDLGCLLIPFGTGGGRAVKAFDKSADIAKGASKALNIPSHIDNAGKFVSWARQFEKKKAPLTKAQVDELVAQAKRFGVKVEASAGDLVGHKGKAGENWGIPHIHIGEARIHIPVPKGYKLK